MGKILITGASGNVGRYVAQYALENGQEITVAGTNPDRLTKMFKDRAEIVYFDFTDSATFHDALKDVDRVFIMRPPHLGKPEDLKPFIEALKAKGGIKLVSFLSLIGVENNPFPPHHKIEKYIEQGNLPYCHIRPSFFMQNISGVHAFEIKYFNRIIVPVKKSLTSFIDAEDIGEITAKVLSEPEKHQNKGYSITGAEAIDYWQVADILSKELGREIIYTNPKPSFTQKYWIEIRGMEKEYCTVMGILYLMTRLGTANKVTSVFEQIMGKKPRSFQQFVEKNIASWQ
ncbi:NmrA family NAD(P)-binding protein [Lachnospiraceae bacterium WCA-9-b2]|jgi:Predicted nucleoside-diphosphate-sugar epimerases|uniref:NmrA family NAD(P)-binding protein n=1 Tax=Sporofaciens musculi TaxID=2681861 RepID=A0A7X3MJZ2_9FIRM|nr:NmrA family NAD(P)-binding protein [Sporofaciens musculi]MCI9423362.1 NmrA family NAD(P)-binding protein [Dorea sp.]MXP77805.1 NmrA family NAD(P)-binding protein [Sporofaciens musculi]